jgi:hypothetical protein
MKILKINPSCKIFSLILIFTISSCSDDFLEEQPLSSLSADNTLTSKEGFELYLNGLMWAAREEYTQDDNTFFITNFPGTDVGEDAGSEYSTYRNWISYLTPITGEVNANWDWAYSTMIPQANTIIVYANKPESENIWENEAEKNAVIAQARFFRGYTFNFLANLYGGVPIVDTIRNSPRFDFTRASRKEVYEFAKNDLEFASEWLKSVGEVSLEGRPVKAAADHLLTEVYISLEEYDLAIQSASRVINSGNYQLMTTRFGGYTDQPGDPYSDLFLVGNQNRSSGNLESIYVWQFEEYTSGGGGTRDGNAVIRNVGPFLNKIKAPDGVTNIVTDELGRGVGRVRGTNYSIYDIWNDPSDMRNSPFNFRREFYYNNPDSQYFGKPVEGPFSAEDTLRTIYPYPRKIEGEPWEDNNRSGRITNDVYVYRLAETYLLRAEAHFRNGDLVNAAADINTLRARANAEPISPEDVDIEFILDERARELLFEEPRRRTLIRMGLLVERVREHGLLEGTRTTIQDHHGIWPIPQKVIDANIGADFEQNPGY